MGFWSTVAWAAGPAPGSSLGTATLWLLAFGAAWLAAHFLVERAQQRLLALTGVEYVVLGLLLGPLVLPGSAPFAGAGGARPLLAFVVGWIGFLSGVSLDLGGWVRERRATFLSWLDLALTAGAVGATAWVVLSTPALVPSGAPPREVLLVCLGLACAAAAPSGAAVALLEARYPGRSSVLLPFLRRVSPPAEAVVIGLVGGLFCLFHVGATIAVRPPGPVEWMGFTVGTGLALAVCFLLFLGRDRSQNHVFLAATGTLLFASGTAFFLNLSALTVNLVLGLALGRTAVGPGIRAAIDRTEGPARLVLLVFAGTLWRPVAPWPALLLPAAVLGARLGAKALAGFVGTLGSGIRGDVFRGTWAQGNVAVAIAVSLRMAYEGPLVDLAFHTVLVAVVVAEITAPRALRGLLVDAGELDQDLGPEPARAGA